MIKYKVVMDFLDPNKKRSNIVKRYVGYVLVAVAVAMGALVLLFAIFGYGYSSGKVVQNGLVFLSSQPDAAQVYIEGLSNKIKNQGQTNTKFTLREGKYRATIVKEGYRLWQKEFTLEGGSVERLVYPFLFPEDLKTENRATFTKQPDIVSSSPDRQWILVQQPEFTRFLLFNANDPTAEPEAVAMPGNLLSRAVTKQSLEVVEWANDNVHVLFKHSFDDKTEFIVFNRETPGRSFNVNTLSGQTPYEVSLKDKKVDQLYLLTAKGGLLESIDVASKSLTPLVGKTLAYKSHGDDMLVFVEPHKTDDTLVSVKITTNDKTYELRTLPSNTSYVVDVARFDNSWYVAVGAGSENRVYIYKDPLIVLTNENPTSSIFARTMGIQNPQHVSFSANTRFIAAQSGKEFSVYDAEDDRQYRYIIEEDIDTSQPAQWMDGHRLKTSINNTAFVFEFDGLNKQSLMPIAPSTDVLFDRDYTYAYAVVAAGEGAHLTQTPLQVE